MADYTCESWDGGARWAPVIETYRMGLRLGVKDGERLQVEWMPAPGWRSASLQTDVGRFDVRHAVREVHNAVVPLEAGEILVPLTRNPGGGVTAVWVRIRRIEPVPERVAAR